MKNNNMPALISRSHIEIPYPKRGKWLDVISGSNCQQGMPFNFSLDQLHVLQTSSYSSRQTFKRQTCSQLLSSLLLLDLIERNQNHSNALWILLTECFFRETVLVPPFTPLKRPTPEEAGLSSALVRQTGQGERKVMYYAFTGLYNTYINIFNTRSPFEKKTPLTRNLERSLNIMKSL